MRMQVWQPISIFFFQLHLTLLSYWMFMMCQTVFYSYVNLIVNLFSRSLQIINKALLFHKPRKGVIGGVQGGAVDL